MPEHQWFVLVTYIDGTREEREIYKPEKDFITGTILTYYLIPFTWSKTDRWVKIVKDEKGKKKVTFPDVNKVGVRDPGFWEQSQIPIAIPNERNQHIAAISPAYYYQGKNKIYITHGGKRRRTFRKKSRKQRKSRKNH